MSELWKPLLIEGDTTQSDFPAKKKKKSILYEEFVTHFYQLIAHSTSCYTNATKNCGPLLSVICCRNTHHDFTDILCLTPYLCCSECMYVALRNLCFLWWMFLKSFKSMPLK